MIKQLLVLFILASSACAGFAENGDGLVLGEFRFITSSAELDPKVDQENWQMLAETYVLFGNRRDVSLVASVSENHLLGTLAAERRNKIYQLIREFGMNTADAVVSLDFSADQNPDVLTLQLVPNEEASAFCPWHVVAQLDGWTEAIQFPAGIERTVPQSARLAVRFVAEPTVPYSKSIIECDGEQSSCFVFLISSSEPIKAITLPEIRSALLDQGKGTGAALLPTALSGSTICEIGIGPDNF